MIVFILASSNDICRIWPWYKMILWKVVPEYGRLQTQMTSPWKEKYLLYWMTICWQPSLRQRSSHPAMYFTWTSTGLFITSLYKVSRLVYCPQVSFIYSPFLFSFLVSFVITFELREIDSDDFTFFVYPGCRKGGSTCTGNCVIIISANSFQWDQFCIFFPPLLLYTPMLECVWENTGWKCQPWQN